MTARTTELLLRMPEKPERDLSRFLLSPMPGPATRLEVAEGRSVRVEDPLLVIEAMKKEDVRRADHDCVAVGRCAMESR